MTRVRDLPVTKFLLGRRLADPTVRGALRGKNHSKQRPPRGAEGPAQLHTPLKVAYFLGTICPFLCGKFQRVPPLVFMI